MTLHTEQTPEEGAENQNAARHHDQPSDAIKGKTMSEELRERLADEPHSLGVDLDGTNPGSNKHPTDLDQ